MCGLCGEIAFGEAASATALSAMAARLGQRGPDAAGLFVQDGLGLGHRRLSILDLSSASQQPMIDAELGLAIAFNGCIYNFRELRAELIDKGFRFFSRGDTEVILKAYAAWGPRCLERFYGVFAFALWERASGRVVLARDRLGIKPLYYSEGNNRLRFASTLPALLAAGDVNTTVDPAALHHYMSFHAVVPAPLTLLKGAQAAAGHHHDHRADGSRGQEKYWRLPSWQGREESGLSEADWAQRVLDTLAAATERRRVAGVPVGVLLSGGLDSSLLVALLARAGHSGLKTFSIGFESVGDQRGDEFRYSDLIAEKFATDHQRIRIDSARALDALPGAIAAMSEPMMSHDAIGFYLLGEQVARHVKVAQSGQGADETFGGYHWYPALMQSNDPVSDYARVYFDRDHDEMGEAIAPELMERRL